MASESQFRCLYSGDFEIEMLSKFSYISVHGYYEDTVVKLRTMSGFTTLEIGDLSASCLESVLFKYLTITIPCACALEVESVLSAILTCLLTP